MPANRIAPTDGLSRVAGATAVALLDDTIPQLLKRAVERYPDREAAVFSAPVR